MSPNFLRSSARPVVLFNRVGASVFDAFLQHKVLTAAATQRELAMTCRFRRTQDFYLHLAAWFPANPNLTFFYVHVCPPATPEARALPLRQDNAPIPLEGEPTIP